MLYDRLAARGYAQKKIEENIECEIMDETAFEVRESYKPEIIMELQSNEENDVQNNLEKIIEWIKVWVANKNNH